MLIKEFTDNLSQLGCSHETVVAYRGDLRSFYAFMRRRGRRSIKQINHKLLISYIKHLRRVPNPRFRRKGLSDASIARHLAVISSFIKFARVTRFPKLQNPVADLSLKWKMNREPKPVDDSVLNRLLESITNLRDRTLFTLFLATGLRISEMHQLNRNSIELREEFDPGEDPIPGQGHVRGSGKVIGKGGKSRTFFVDPVTLQLYCQYALTRRDDNPALFVSSRGKRMSVRTMQYALGACCRRAGLSRINIHRLRHSFATRLANADISAMQLKDLMGHESFSTTMRYFRLSEKTLARGYFAAMENIQR